jgi:3-isopropylmalate/(R)-2-methylmalate dehydratase small subunit
MFKPFSKKETLSAVVLNRSNMDTDAMMPAFVLKKTDETGYDEYLFDPLRFKDKGSLDKKPSDRVPNEDFELNKFEDLFGKKPGLMFVSFYFACGSSREQAVKGLVQYGIRVIIGYSDLDSSPPKAAFDDIFFNSSPKNGLLLIELPKDDVAYLMTACEVAHGIGVEFPVEVDLVNQCIFAAGKEFKFDIDQTMKNKLLEVTDDADKIKADYSEDIKAWKEKTKKEKPFLLEPISG